MLKLFKFTLAAGLVFFTMALLISTAQAQQICGDRSGMIKTLMESYTENQIGIGMTGTIMYEIWVNNDTGTWSILRTFPNGTSCIMVVGEDWISFDPPVPGQNS